jgi:hypothetical protein
MEAVNTGRLKVDAFLKILRIYLQSKHQLCVTAGQHTFLCISFPFSLIYSSIFTNFYLCFLASRSK